jgi:hypothetical protein
MAKRRLRCRLGWHRFSRQVSDEGDVYGECICGKRDPIHWVSELPDDHDPPFPPNFRSGR